MSEVHCFHYVDLSSGRYLCETHGGFCDERDGFRVECPICIGSKQVGVMKANRVQRTIKVINGLQDRSKRNVGLVSAIVGGVGFLALFKQLVGDIESDAPVTFQSVFLELQSASEVLIVLALVFFVFSLALFAASMSQVPVVKSGKIEMRSHDKWETYLVCHLGKMEWRHKYASVFFILGLTLLACIPALSLLQSLHKALCS